MALLEICCYGVDCAISAQNAGADRIELCSAPNEGGLTPSAGVLHSVRQLISIPVHPIIRPRGGDFCYSDAEFITMLEDIAFIRDIGFPGFVTGILDEDGHVDNSRMRQIMIAGKGMAVTFHRAFDMCANPLLAAKQLANMGIARILTSGQQQTALEGLALLRELNHQSHVPIIMAGAGIRPDNLKYFIESGIKEVHSSAREPSASPVRYRKSGISMSAGGVTDEFNRYGVDAHTVATMKTMLIN